MACCTTAVYQATRRNESKRILTFICICRRLHLSECKRNNINENTHAGFGGTYIRIMYARRFFGCLLACLIVLLCGHILDIFCYGPRVIGKNLFDGVGSGREDNAIRRLECISRGGVRQAWVARRVVQFPFPNLCCCCRCCCLHLTKLV